MQVKLHVCRRMVGEGSGGRGETIGIMRGRRRGKTQEEEERQGRQVCKLRQRWGHVCRWQCVVRWWGTWNLERQG